MIKTGIVTANYNNEKFLSDWLDGLRKQTQKPNFVSFVDDCSTDGSINRLKELLETEGDIDNGPIKCKKWGIDFCIQKLKTNSGPAKARNESVKWLSENTDAQICFVYDSDDIYHPDKIKKTMSIYNNYPYTGIVYSDYDMIYENGDPPKREFKEPFALDRLTQECIISNNSSYPIKLFDMVGGYDESLYGPEDYDLWIRMSEVCTSLHIPEALYSYRIGENNITVKTEQSKFAEHVRRVHEKTYLRRQNAHSKRA